MKVLLSAMVLLSSLSASALSIGTYNIRNFDYDQRYRIQTNKTELETIIKNMNVDVLSVEGINNTAAWDKFVQTKLPGYDTEVSVCGGEHGQRLGFLYNTNTVELLSFNEDLSIVEPGTPGSCDAGSRPMAIGLFRVKASGQKFYGITLHLKSGNRSSSLKKRAQQFQILQNTILDLQNRTGVKEFYFAGDLNTTDYLTRGQDYQILNRLIQNLGMVHLTSNLKCSAYYWGGTDDGIETPSLLDHVVATPGLIRLKSRANVQTFGHCQKVSCREVPINDLGISYESVSDHCPIAATIQ